MFRGTWVVAARVPVARALSLTGSLIKPTNPVQSGDLKIRFKISLIEPNDDNRVIRGCYKGNLEICEEGDEPNKERDGRSTTMRRATLTIILE